MTFDPESFRRAMRAWTTGVAIIFSGDENESYGMTINSFSSLSLDPPLATVVLRNDSRVFDLVRRSSAFSVNILSDSQRELAESFAGKLHGEKRMADVSLTKLPGGASILDDGAAWFDCRVIHVYAAGQNTLFVAEVVGAGIREAERPLTYHNREYHTLAK